MEAMMGKIRKRHPKFNYFLKHFKHEKFLHFLVLPTVVYFIIFNYIPLYGLQIAFKDFSFGSGIMGSPWIGFQHFKDFFSSIYFWRLIKNTILLSGYSLLFGFPIPIIFALMLNEVRNKFFKKAVQTASYFPHFVSEVLIIGILVMFLAPGDGIVNIIRTNMGLPGIPFMQSAEYFRTLYISTGIWAGFGWGSIIYLSALTNIPPSHYEAAVIDGANRWEQTLHITIPGIIPTIMIMLILAIGGLMSVGFQKIILMYNPAIYDVSDVISTYVYRKAMVGGEFSYGTAVGLFNNVINFSLVYVANSISKKVCEVSLW